jgi:hypothetical protein
VWGPGRQAREEWYQKRLSIVQAINEANPLYDVRTSETLFEDEPPESRYDIETAKKELFHANEANLIIALIVGSSRQQGGIYRELDTISHSRKLREKTWIFHPAKARFLRQFQSGALRSFRDDHKVAYTDEMFRTCHSIRRACVDKANEEHRQLLLDHLNTTIGK